LDWTNSVVGVFGITVKRKDKVVPVLHASKTYPLLHAMMAYWGVKV